VLIDWFTVLAQIINFLILILLLRRFLYGPIMKAMEERKRRIAAAMEQAKKAEEEAKQLSTELLQEKESLFKAKETLMFEARKEVEAWKEKTLKDIKLEVEKLRQSWMDRLNQDKAVFFQKLKNQVAGHVMHIGEKVLQDLANERLEKQVISVFLQKVEAQKDHLELGRAQGKVRVQSGFELDPEHSGNLRQKLEKWLPKAQTVEFDVARDFGIGIQLQVGDRKVEWNLADYLEGLEKEILSDLVFAGKERV
jgi:F-type H+-transporting ATPase subunit b